MTEAPGPKARSVRARPAARGVAALGMAALLGAGSIACGALGPAEPGSGGDGRGRAVIAEADLRVLFVGNSLTYTHDLPATVQALADADGRSMAHGVLVAPGYSLEEHWAFGAADVIAEQKPDVVVLQQGPSSLPDNQRHLAYWTREFDRVIRDAGGVPALFMVWPSRDRFDFFDDVRDAYRGAADSVGGIFLPAGLTWLEAWELEPDLRLYGPDGFHPSALGSAAAALTIYATLLDVPAAELPTPPGVADDDMAVLRSAVDSARAGANSAPAAAAPRGEVSLRSVPPSPAPARPPRPGAPRPRR